ncbi:MAG: hypothetical protein IKS45_10385, partial [Thermoguttaceae bacterium]|nr:hypothetical protein [Thermoguttaceae bacterium]
MRKPPEKYGFAPIFFGKISLFVFLKKLNIMSNGMNLSKCFFCGAPLNPNVGYFPHQFHGQTCNCPICGEYFLSFVTYINEGREFKNQPNRVEVSQVLAERKFHKKSHVAFMQEYDNSPLDNPLDFSDLNFEVLSFNQVLEQFPHDPLEMSERILLSLSTLASTPFDKVDLWNYSDPTFSFRALFCHTEDDLRDVLDYCETAGWVKNDRSKDGRILNCFLITPKGWERIKELRKRLPGEKPQIFVAMWFSPEVDETFAAIRDTIEMEGLKAYRIDKHEYNNNICDEMFAEIQRSSALIADYTGNRPNVYYEAGYAKGLGIPVIMLIPKSDLDNNDKKPHFDIAQYNFIAYDGLDDLKQRLRQR